MDAPLYNALCVLRGQKGLRMHMPGHKGKSPAAEFSTAAALDYTEIDPTGNLYTGEGPIAAAEALAAQMCIRDSYIISLREWPWARPLRECSQGTWAARRPRRWRRASPFRIFRRAPSFPCPWRAAG